ncbi:hypothetical protein PINS_up017150 [Pythium insidiosum]|nr:hypothetical protein PINS_up017150 [Pythium insidiosum]
MILDVIADANLPAVFINRASVKRLIREMCPFVQHHIPDRRVITGKILDDAAAECEKLELSQVKEPQDMFGRQGQRSLQMDPGTEHDGIALTKIMDRVIENVRTKELQPGSCVTDNAGVCEKIRGLLIKRHPDMVFLKCFAHDINNLVKDVLKSNFSKIGQTPSSIVNYLNTASSTWLPKIQQRIVFWYR